MDFYTSHDHFALSSTQVHNGLNGQVPTELIKLSNLQSLELLHQSLSGTIPTELGLLTMLTQLDFSGNKLQGVIPAEIFSGPRQLDQLWLRSNALTGTIPTVVGLFPGRGLRLDDNQLTGQIPPDIYGLSNLQWLFLFGNYVSDQLELRTTRSCLVTRTETN